MCYTCSRKRLNFPRILVDLWMGNSSVKMKTENRKLEKGFSSSSKQNHSLGKIFFCESMEAEEYFSKDLEWEELKREILNDPSLQYHLLPFEPSSSPSLVSPPEEESNPWRKFHRRHHTGKFFKVPFIPPLFLKLLLRRALYWQAAEKVHGFWTGDCCETPLYWPWWWVLLSFDVK